ncbi:MAG: type II toxin-antitoxin system HicA family toxin [Deltaproteobacteria bacterium]|jgi:predicted RNA binding protein YcfA (HicA-like mRNA interferase family)
MPSFGPIKRSDLGKYLRKCGFDGPYSGGKHPFMVKGNLTFTIPSPHQKDIGKELLIRILGQARISRGEWEKL